MIVQEKIYMIQTDYRSRSSSPTNVTDKCHRADRPGSQISPVPQQSSCLVMFCLSYIYFSYIKSMIILRQFVGVFNFFNTSWEIKICAYVADIEIND